MLSTGLMVVVALNGALPVVVIDPGHGGPHIGARGVCDVLEKDIALSISKELAAVLDASAKAQAVLTRTTDVDVPLAQRGQIANRLRAALFVSVHANSSTNPNAQGVEAYFLSNRSSNRRVARLAMRENQGANAPKVERGSVEQILAGLALNHAHHQSQKLAITMQRFMHNKVVTRGRGVLQAPFAVLRESHAPAALIEVGFLSHAEECKKLKSQRYQRKIAKTLAGGILAHLATTTPQLAQRTLRP